MSMHALTRFQLVLQVSNVLSSGESRNRQLFIAYRAQVLETYYEAYNDLPAMCNRMV
jgi:hypothetical protein